MEELALSEGNYAADAQAAWPEAEFAAVFRGHYARLLGVAVRVVGERALAEEIVDDAFWKLYRRPRLRQEGNNVPAWLYRAVTRLALDALRARRRAEIGRARIEATADGAGQMDALRELQRREQAGAVRRTLQRLKPSQARILILRYSGLSYEALATALQLKPTSVGTTLARAEAAFEREYERGTA